MDVETTNNSLQFPSINVMIKLDSPDASAIKDLEGKIEKFSHEYGFAAKEGQTPLFEAL